MKDNEQSLTEIGRKRTYNNSIIDGKQFSKRARMEEADQILAEKESDTTDSFDCFQIQSEEEAICLIKKFNFFVEYVGTCKRKHTGDISIDSLKLHVQDFTMSDLHKIVSMLPHAFRLYYPKKIIQKRTGPISSNINTLPSIYVEVLLDNYSLFNVINEFQKICKANTGIKFKWAKLPPLPSAPQVSNTQLQEQRKNGSTTSNLRTISDTSNIVHSELFNKSVETEDDILSADTLKKLAQNESNKKRRQMMEEDLKRRTELAKVLEVAVLINTILKLEDKQRMKLNDLKKQVVIRSMNSLSREDVSIAINQLISMPDQKWCRLEKLQMHDDKVFIINDEEPDSNNNGGQSFSEVKKLLKSKLQPIVNITHDANGAKGYF
jgi:hypothetical protein